MLAAALGMTVVAALLSWPRGEEAAIRRRLDGLTTDINAGVAEGLDTVARAVRIGGYFTPDAVIDLGRGASPLEGRTLLTDMAARLQPRTSRYRVAFTDVTVTMTGAATAEVQLTATIAPRDDDGDLDAREFHAEMAKEDGEWRIRRATAVQPLR